MNIIKLVNNKYLSSIYPDGLTGKVLLGQIGLDIGGRIYLNIHTQQEPAIRNSKWGDWGDKYNVIVIKISGRSSGLAKIENWERADYCDLTVTAENDHIVISQSGPDWSLELSIKDLLLQGFETYIL